jgi:hypothetical protein
MAKEDYKMSSCFLKKYIHFAQTRIFQTTLQTVKVGLYSIHPFWFYLYLQYEQIRTLHNFPVLHKSVAWRKGPRHLLPWVHILFDHMETFLREIFLSLSMHNPWIERNGCVSMCGMQTVLLRLQYVYLSVIVSLVK